MAIPRSLAWLFPEHDASDLDPERDSRLILARVLEHGRLRDVRWCVRRYGLDRIHRFFREEPHPEVSERTLALWRVALKAKNEEWATSRPGLAEKSRPGRRAVPCRRVAVAHHLKHRRSNGLDLFSRDPKLDLDAVHRRVTESLEAEVVSLSDATLNLRLGGAPIDVVRYPYRLLVRMSRGPEGVHVAGLRDHRGRHEMQDDKLRGAPFGYLAALWSEAGRVSAADAGRVYWVQGFEATEGYRLGR